MPIPDALGRFAAPSTVYLVTGSQELADALRLLAERPVQVMVVPVDDAAFLAAVDAARADDEQRLALREALRARLATLTPREREAMPLIAAGLLNKQAAAALGIAEVTLQLHRARIMRKMQAGSLAELVRMAELLGLLPHLSAA